MEGVFVLSIIRKILDEESFIGTPKGDTIIMANDILTTYGPSTVCHCLTRRPIGEEGDQIHIMRSEMKANQSG